MKKFLVCCLLASAISILSAGCQDKTNTREGDELVRTWEQNIKDTETGGLLS